MSSKNATAKHHRRWRYGPVDAAATFTEDPALYAYVPNQDLPPVLDHIDTSHPDPRFTASILSRADNERGVPFYTVQVWLTGGILADPRAIDRGELLPIYVKKGEDTRTVRVYADNIACIVSPLELQRFEHIEYEKAAAVAEALARLEAEEALAAAQNELSDTDSPDAPRAIRKRRGRPPKRPKIAADAAATASGPPRARMVEVAIVRGSAPLRNGMAYSVDGAGYTPNRSSASVSAATDNSDDEDENRDENAVFFDTRSSTAPSDATSASDADELADHLANNSFITASALSPEDLHSPTRRRMLVAAREDEYVDGYARVELYPASESSEEVSAAALLAEFTPKGKRERMLGKEVGGYEQEGGGVEEDEGDEIVFDLGSSGEDDLMADDEDEDGYDDGAAILYRNTPYEEFDDELRSSSPTIRPIPERRGPY